MHFNTNIVHNLHNKHCFQNASAMTKARSLAIEKPENVFAKAYMASMARPVMKVSFFQFDRNSFLMVDLKCFMKVI